MNQDAPPAGLPSVEDVPQAGWDEAAQVLSDAFETDPHLSWFIRQDAKRTVARRKFFDFILQNMAGPVARIERPVGGGAAAVWMPSEALTPSTVLEDLGTLPIMLRTTGLARLGRLMTIRKVMDAQHPRDIRHSYLWFLGVSPDRQGQGLGSLLLKQGLARADAEGIAAWLETGTERNVALYTRHGFEAVHAAPVTPGGPMMWHMLRQPKG
jgi:ribosomal protein S18 acetylase RimI-like enzyme